MKAGFLLTSILLAAPFAGAGEPGGLTEAQRQGRALAADLRATTPAPSDNAGVLKVRDANRRWTEIPFRCVVTVASNDWQTLYETTGSSTNAVRLVVTHRPDRPNQYQLTQDGGPPIALTGEQTMRPFAGTDFWVADLGLEFFHWPDQRILKSDMRRGRSCKVLESVNPDPGPGRYRRVVSWIDRETGGIVQAEAYDDRNVLLKEFAPKDFEKVNGQWELKEMRIRNVQTGSQTTITFNLAGQ